MIFKRKLKIFLFLFRYLKASLFSRALMVRFIPTNECNLRCAYCWQWREGGEEMSEKGFLSYLRKAMDLGVGIVDFMGGEPLVWKYIFKAVEECSKHYIITNLNTNGLILNHEVVDRLGRSGLDHLNVSIDGIKSSFVSKKCLDNNEILISSLERARDKWKIKVRVNSVIHKTNFAELKKLIEILHKHNIPLTLGFVVPPLGYEGAGNKLFFSLEDRDSLKKIVSYIIKKKKETNQV